MNAALGLLSALFLVVLVVVLATSNSKVKEEYVNERPTIAIVTLPEYEQGINNPYASNTTYIHSQYVKYVESVGAVVIPIHYNEKPEKIEYLMDHINGVIFTGGGLNFTTLALGEWLPYTYTVNTIFQKAKKLNENGIHFPIWGTWMGHQFMMFLVSNDTYLLKRTNSYNSQDNVKFSFKNKYETKLFSNFSDEILNDAESKNITANFHNWSIVTEDFLSEKQPYSKFFKLLATSQDRNGVSYVSNSEAINYPFFSSQYHPEVTLYTFAYNFTDHSKEARDFAYNLSLKFINEARKNIQKFDSFSELQSLLVQTTGVNKLGYTSSGEFYDNFYFYIGKEQEYVSE